MKSFLLRAALLLALLIPAAPATADQSSLCLPTSGTVSGLTLATGMNAALNALASASSGDNAPTNPCTGAPVEGQAWLATSGSYPVTKIFDGTQFAATGALDESTGSYLPQLGGGASSLASAATVDLWSIPQSYVVITGTTPITKLAGSDAEIGSLKTVSFAGALTITHDATQLIVPGGRSRQTEIGDKAVVVALGGGNVAIVDYTPATGETRTGHIDQFLLSSCPANSIEPNGGTIGDASSGASIRANADTYLLYAAMWALDSSATPIYTSAGASSTRGASAAADFAAHKRLTVPDMRGTFLRALDNGRGLDASRLLGSVQSFSTSASGLSASATSTFTGTPMAPHSHTINLGSNDTNGGIAADGNTNSALHSTSSVSAGTPSGTVSTSVSLSGAAETRPTNTAVLTCVHL